MRVYVEGIGLFGPGLVGWTASRDVLAGRARYTPSETMLPAAALLPANERRRAPKIVRIALTTGAEALAAAGRDPALVPAIFTSSGGDGDTIHEIMSTLASPQRELSPTRFHNSVHNVVAGYWSIATGSRAPSSSLCCHDGSFAAGLMEACVQAAAIGEAVAIIAYDVPYPSPLAEVRHIGHAFSVALLLSPHLTPVSFARLELKLTSDHPLSQNAEPALDELRRATPAARSLPLLVALAENCAAAITLPYLPDLALMVTLEPVEDL